MTMDVGIDSFTPIPSTFQHAQVRTDEFQRSAFAPEGKPATFAENTRLLVDDAILKLANVTYISDLPVYAQRVAISEGGSYRWGTSWVNVGPQNEKDESDHEEIAERLISDKLELMARKYAEKAVPREHEARLLIVREKLRRLMPRVVESDYDRLNEMAAAVKKIADASAKLRTKRLGK